MEPPEERCGDGIVKGAEFCDDGNDDTTDACTNTCEFARCGDGIRRTDITGNDRGAEGCDDGNDSDEDGCKSGCVQATCGDGILRLDLSPGEDGYEACDDGNSLEEDACLTGCVAAACGDGVLRQDLGAVADGYEVCDDGNQVDGDACTNACRPAECNDGVLRTGLSAGDEGYEACDDGNVDDFDGCRVDCSLARCGDGVVRQDLEPGEAGYEGCDDGNILDEDACLSNCAEARCGDGVVRVDLDPDDDAYESCDDGNASDMDDCLTDCQRARCGDGIIRTEGDREPEGCDDGDEINTNGCLNDCRVAVCGDGVHRTDLGFGQDGYEACDDGNLNAGDDCSAICRFELIQVTAGYAHTCALRADGRAFCWGANDHGQLGERSRVERGMPAVVVRPEVPNQPEDEGYRSLAAGNLSTCALTQRSNRVLCWGANAQGQLGLGNRVDRVEPHLLESPIGASLLSAGGQHACALTNGSVYCWGRNDLGQLGLGEAGERLLVDGAVQGPGGREIADIVNLKAKNHVTCAQEEQGGALYCWGANGDQQLGTDVTSFFDQAQTVAFEADHYAVGGYHVCYSVGTRRVMCMGRNEAGQVHPDGDHAILARQVPNVPAVDERIRQLHAGGGFSCVTTDEDNLRCWGANDHGQLGLGGDVSSTEEPGPAVTGFESVYQVAVGFDHACALDRNRILRCWGRNDRRQLGLGNDVGDHLTDPEQGVVNFED